MVSETSDFNYLNAYSCNNELIRAILFAATNHLIKRNVCGYKKGSFSNKANILMTELIYFLKIHIIIIYKKGLKFI